MSTRRDGSGVEYLNYWFDYERQHAFCLAKGPDAEAVDAVHREAHGQVANQIIEVQEQEVRRFMGGIDAHPPGEAYIDTAFRVILFTDLQGSTSLTQQLGDADAMTILRHHDRIVREAIEAAGGTVVKHTGDGAMASFRAASSALEAAVAIQRGLAHAEVAGLVPHRGPDRPCGRRAGQRGRGPLRCRGAACRQAVREGGASLDPRREQRP